MLPKKHIEDFYKVCQVLLNNEDVNDIIKKTFEAIFKTISAQRGILLIKSNENKFNIFCSININDNEIEEEMSIISRTIGEIEKSEKSILKNNIQMEEFNDSHSSVEIYDIYSLIAVPIFRNGELHGIIYFDTKTSHKQFDRTSLEFVDLIVKWLALLVENHKLYDIINDKLLNPSIRERNIKMEDIVVKSPVSYQIFEKLKYYANNSIPFLIVGEKGTGKSFSARTVHNSSQRSSKPFIVIDCTEITDNNYKDYITAKESGKSSMLNGDGGTVLFKYLEKMPLKMQKEILKILKKGIEISLSGNIKKKLDVRYIFSATKYLDEEVKEGKFLDELYFFLKGNIIYIPPLRDRKEDIEAFVEDYLSKVSFSKKNFTKKTMQVLKNYEWNGNYDELKNVISSALLASRDRYIGIKDLPLEIQRSKSNIFNIPVKTLKEVEKETILKTLEIFNGNRKITAEKLGISLRALQYKIKEYSEGK
ncbi:sigma-54-dependent Fis family transcriptional regulator [candidate division WOR-3 bacterium]|nr:sigma-54-dependent Fis family transcriptional regulator [candidate division WOR-3 bacterium]